MAARRIQDTFETNGTEIFSDRASPQWKLAKLWDFLRSVSGSKYSDAPLRKTIEQIVGSRTRIGDLRHATIIPSVNLTTGAPQIFKTPHHPELQRDWRLSISDVALATSAAPTYFPLARVGDALFADGGLFANSPDLLALHEAEYFFKAPAEEINMLSIGTTTTTFSLAPRDRALGLWGWRRHIGDVIISAQQMDVGYLMRHKLGDRYFRIDRVQSGEHARVLALDVATEEAQTILRGLAAASVQEVVNNTRLRRMLDYRAAPPRFYYGPNAPGKGR
jgi:patatin-like phospholipase/acyl hydrolase